MYCQDTINDSSKLHGQNTYLHDLSLFTDQHSEFIIK